jgi:hypothetical protein
MRGQRLQNWVGRLLQIIILVIRPVSQLSNPLLTVVVVVDVTLKAVRSRAMPKAVTFNKTTTSNSRPTFFNRKKPLVSSRKSSLEHSSKK